MFKLIYQPFSKPSLPDASFEGRTIIVTGANVGLGQEAAAHFVRLGAARVVATARSKSKCESTKAAIETLSGKTGVVEAWELEYSNYESVKQFCHRVDTELERLDAVVLNASIATQNFEVAEGDENSITVNVISTSLLAALLLPVLRRSAAKYSTDNTLNVVSSEVNTWAKFPERNEDKIFASMSDPNTKTMAERYPSTKLLQCLAVREVADLIKDSKPFVTVNSLSPGLNKTSLGRSATGFGYIFFKTITTLFGWEPEVGARTLVNAVVMGKESHGRLLDCNKLENNSLAPWVETDEGLKVQKKVWSELEAKLEAIAPGCIAAMSKDFS